MALYYWAMVALPTFFHMLSMASLMGDLGMEFRGKIKLYCLREVKCKQGFTIGI